MLHARSAGEGVWSHSSPARGGACRANAPNNSDTPGLSPPPSPVPPQELDLKIYAKVVCTLLDIPVYENPIESLHVLFTLYLEFKNNPVFRQHMELENRLEEEVGGAEGGGANIFTM